MALVLRVYHLDRYPLDANSDGLTYTWVGSSMWSEPLDPQGVSMFVANNPNLFWFSHYNYYDTVRKYDFRLVSPFLDQPPFMMPLLGILPRAFGYSDFEPIPEVLVRLPAILASAATLALTYLLGRKLFGRKIGLLAVMILGWTPYFVFAHRELFLENLLTPLYLLGLVLVWESQKKISFKLGLILTLLAGVAPLFKVAGVVLSAALGFWLWYFKHRGWSVVVLGAGLLGLVSYVAFGWLLHPEAFSWVLQAQSSRGVYAAAFGDFLFKAEFYESFKDGWYLLGWISWIWLAWSRPKDLETRFVVITGLIMVIGVMGLAGPQNNFPWYRYPMFPFLSLSVALLIQKFWQRPTAASLTVLSFFGLANAHFLSSQWPIFGNSVLLRLGWLVLLGLMLLSETKAIPNAAKWQRLMLGMLLALGLSLNILVSLSYPKVFCSLQECKLPTKIVVPQLDNVPSQL